MTEENLDGGLSPAEEAYFSSGGEQPIPGDAATSDKEPDNAAEEQAKPQEDEQAEAVQRERDEKGKFVPHGALHAEREEHKKTRSELNELREKWARIEERIQWMQAAKEQPQQEEETPPDPNDDIFAFAKYQQRQIEQLRTKQAEKEQIEQQTRAQQEAEQRVWSYWEADAGQYAQANPDFGNAAKWLSEFRDKQLKAIAKVDSRFSDVRARNSQIEQELKGIIIAAAQQGRSAAEVVYEIATEYGYAPAQQKQAPATEQLQRISKAQEAARTVGAAAGNSGGDEMSLDSIMAMPRGEFEAWIKDAKNERLFNKLMGG